MKCKHCGCEDFTVMTSMIVSMPFDMYHNLTKKKMLKKEFEVWGVNWDLADFICKECGNTVSLREEKPNE